MTEAVRWTDGHCHLHGSELASPGRWEDRAGEIAEVVADARAAGVERLVTVGCDVADSRNAIDVASAHAGVVATAGVHPHEARNGVDGLEELLGRPEVVAVGECGLDYHYEHSPREAQRQVFAAQIALAHAHDLALVIHTREAWDDTFDVLAAEGVPARTVFHCFTGGPDEVRRCLDLGAYVSISGIITFKTASDVREAVALCPPERLTVETDAPYLTPVPHRGQRNRSALVPLVGAAVAEVQGVEAADVAASSWAAAAELYRLPAVTHTRTQLVALLERHGLGPSRALGQNFVVDPNTVRRIARLARIGPDTPVVEVGAGLGSLTLALAETGAPVTAVEIDRHLRPVLEEVVAGLDVTVVAGDAMRLDWSALLAAHERWVLVANLPYNVATPLVLDLLAGVPPAIERMLVMVQREAGERLAAAPGSGAYGIPSVKVALRATAKVIAKVGPDVFLPRPRVDSALVEIVRLPALATDADPDLLVSLVETGFGQRRKMLRRSLATVVPPDAFTAAGIDPQDRPERLSVQDWGRLALAVTAAEG